MRKTFIAVAAIALSLASSDGSSREMCLHQTSLFFGNGMFNSKSDAHASRIYLRDKLTETTSWKRERSYLAYNEDVPALLQLLEVFAQKNSSFSRDFWSWIVNVSNSPKWFRDQILRAQTHQHHVGIESLSFNPQMSSYQRELDLGRNIVVVAHSQGNFFAYSALQELALDRETESHNFHVISVATPESIHDEEAPYFTLTSDGVIRYIPGALTPNSSNVHPEPGLFDHKFKEHYLDGIPTGKKITTSVQKTIQGFEKLQRQKSLENGDSFCWKWFEALNLSRETKLDCEVKCGLEPTDFSDFSCSSNCPEFCACATSRN